MKEGFNKTLFLIDDDLEEHIILKEALQIVDESSTLLTSYDCVGALKLLMDSSVKPDLIFLDLNLPGMTGFECLRELKKMNHLKKIPVVIYTTSTRAEDERMSNEFGASHFVNKPNSFKTLCTLLDVMFEKFLGATTS